MRQQFDGLVY